MQFLPFSSKQLRILMAALATCLLFSSCARTIFSMAGVFEEKATLKPVPHPQKEIVYIPMHHVGKPAFYRDVKRTVDSLHQLGYVLYYELVTAKPQQDSLTKDTLKRKLRKLIGYYNPEGYISKDGKLMGHEFSFVKELTNQPKDEAIGINSSIDKKVDMYAEDLFARYEKEFGTIALNACDYATSFDSSYRCGKIKAAKARAKFLLQWRNDYIAQYIRQSQDQKIMLMYGAKHYDGIVELLR